MGRVSPLLLPRTLERTKSSKELIRGSQHSRVSPVSPVPTRVVQVLGSWATLNSQRSRQPRRSKADVTSTTEAATPGEGPSVFESTPQQHTAAVTYADEVAPEQSDVSVFESQPVKSSATTTYADTVSGGDTAQSVFESQPKQSAAHAKSGVEGDGESEYTTDDDEP